MTDTITRPATAAPAPDVDADADLSVGDALRILARHIDDHELPTPTTIRPDHWGHETHIQVREADYAVWTTALTRWTGESRQPWQDQLHLSALGAIGRLPVQLVTVRYPVEQRPAEA